MKKRRIELDPPFLDKEERDIIEAFNRGKFKQADNFEERKWELEQAGNISISPCVIAVRRPLLRIYATFDVGVVF